jgi:NAD(P)H-quinone oxidoreductase subunit 5
MRGRLLMEIATVLGLVVLVSPLLLLGILGIGSLIDWPLSERNTNRLARLTMLAGLLASLGVFMAMLVQGTRHVTVLSVEWIRLPHYHFFVKFVFDRLSVPLVILTFLLCGIIVSFATRYMHREQGYNRFFTLFAIFIVGMVLTCLAGTIETLFVGWELVGLSSALLVAFLQERPAPVRSGLHIWIIYRVSDAALLLAAILMHHMLGEGDFGRLLATDPAHPWPQGAILATPVQALVIGLLLVVAAAGKSALVPFSGWLPRAMEGPTPSSAVFYGALSVHLGAFLLLRMSPVLAASHVLALLVIVLGLVTATYAYVAGSVQTDIKSVLSFASLAQVGLIVAEIGLGAWIPVLWYMALAHLLGHACVRTLQFVRAPMLLQDYRRLEGAIGGRLRQPNAGYLQLIPVRYRAWIYVFALERGYLDSILNVFVVEPFVKLFGWFDSIERRWCDFLAGRQPRVVSTASAKVQPAADVARSHL